MFLPSLPSGVQKVRFFPQECKKFVFAVNNLENECKNPLFALLFS